MDIASIDETVTEAVIRGEIIASEVRELRNEKALAIFAVTDDTDTINVKLFLLQSQKKEAEEALSKGTFVRVKGRVQMDNWEHELTMSGVQGILKSADFRQGRFDNAALKRVELHCHTKMSDMDGITDASRLGTGGECRPLRSRITVWYRPFRRQTIPWRTLMTPIEKNTRRSIRMYRRRN